MSLAAAVIAAGLLARTAVAPASPPLGGMAMVGDAELTADRFTYEVGTGRVLLEGNAVVRRGAAVLRARSATWDPATGEVRAVGDVLLTDPTRVVAADAVRAILGGDLEAEGVLAFVKDQPADLSGLRTAAEAERAGRNRVTFAGERLVGTPDGHLRLTGARLTLCDCPGDAAPSWEVTAREADVVPGKRAILRGSAVRILGRPVPLLALPWLYVPLADRKSGLLLPTIGSSGASDFGIAQPLYLTLGRSADATLAPEYAFGRSRASVEEGKPAVRGPGARLELRWTPAEAAEGWMELAWIHDLDTEPGGEGGDRWALAGAHAQRIGERTDLAAALRLAGDPVWVRDMTPDVLGRSVPYRRSDVLVSHRRDAAVAEAGASYVQPLRPIETIPGERYGFLGADLDASSRLGSAAATLVPIAAGPLRLAARAGAARFATVGGGLDVVGRPGVARADARAQVEAPILVGGALTVSPFVRGAALGYAFDDASDPAASAWGVAGGTLATEVSRTFGLLRHAVAPRLEWRAGTRVQGEVLPFAAYDAHDRSAAGLLPATTGSFQQLRAAVETRLEGRGAQLVRAELGQDVDLREGRLAETFVAIGGGAGPVRADARASFFVEGRGSPVPEARIPSRLDRLSELRAGLSVQDRRGNGIRAGFFNVAPGGSGTLVAGLDPLFDARPADQLREAAGASAGITTVLRTATISYDATMFGRATFAACPSEPERRFEGYELQQQTGSLSWFSSCRCFRIAVRAGLDYCGARSYHATVDLAGLATALTR